MKNNSIIRALIIPALLLSGLLSAQAGEHVLKDSEKASIASDSKALFDVVISKSATEEVRKSAERLTQILDKMSGAKFTLTEGDGKKGIAVGTINDFPEIPFKPLFNVKDPGESQGYEIKSHPDGIYIIGATPQAAEYAVSNFLYRLGYRNFFPTERWQIIPEKKTLEFSGYIRETPDYFTRVIFPGYGLWNEFGDSTKKWLADNRGNGFQIFTGHVYESIIRNRKKDFTDHPEYAALVNGERKLLKFCVSNPGLQQLVVDYAMKYFEKNPERDSISMEPSDGGGWCECVECKKMGTPSTRAIFLANTVADAIATKYPEKSVCLYAYNQHSQPPEIDVKPNVLVSIATAFIKGGLTFKEVVAGWQAKKAAIGIREYYDVYLWSSSLPGSSRGSNLAYLKRTIPEFYDMGSRHMTAEASDDWGPDGLGYYLAKRMLWNTKEKDNTESIINDFLDKCFGPAAKEMKEFYKLLDGSTHKHLTPDQIGRMYRLIKAAQKQAAGNQDILKRLDDLALYTHYCELYMAFRQAGKEEKEQAFDKMMEFTASIKNSRMVHSRALFREQKRISGKDSENAEEEWKKITPFPQEQIGKLIDDGIEKNKLIDFDIISFSDELVPAFPSDENIQGSYSLIRRGTVTYYTWADDKLQPWELTITGGIIKHYRDRGNVKCDLWKIGGASETGELETLVQSDRSVPPDGNTYQVKLTPKQKGLHKIVINDSGDMTKVEWPLKYRMSIYTDALKPPSISGNFYFYVPKGTKVIGLFSTTPRGTIINPDGKEIQKLGLADSGYISVPVPEGTDGKVWQLKNIKGEIALLTVPPYLSLTPSGLLLPQEVVTKDQVQETKNSL